MNIFARVIPQRAVVDHGALSPTRCLRISHVPWCSFHQVAGQVGGLATQKRYREAESALAPDTPFSAATSEVVLVLSTVKRLGF